MSALPDSFEKVNYLLRPSKQVERKLLVELLQQLSSEIRQYDIRSYTYLGFGSVYYADFMLFHKYLYIDKMICVEGSDIPRRMEFNRPYDFIDIRNGRFSTLLPDLDRKVRYVMWLDYDTSVTDEHLRDVAGAIRVLAPGSVFLVTLDAEPRIPRDLQRTSLSEDERKDRTIDRLQEHCGSLYHEEFGRKHFTKGALPGVLATIVRNQIADAVRKRDDVEFAQLVNFRYKDGAQMVSLGGIVDSAERLHEVRKSSVMELPFVNDTSEPRRISVPLLTVREKLWLEQNGDDAKPTFEVTGEMLANFRRYRRYYPSYYETLL